MAKQKCDGSGVIYSYNRVTQQMQEGICPTCLGQGCSNIREEIQETAHMAWAKLMPWAALAFILYCIYLKTR